MRKVFYILLGLISGAAVAEDAAVPKKASSQILKINQEERLTAKIALDYMNRLAMVNDKIVRIFGDDGTFVHQADDNTGQIFIKPTLDNGLQPLAITIITENGITQDLNLVPSKSKAATIILKSIVKNQELPIGRLGLANRELNIEEQWIQIIKQAVLGELTVLEHRVAPRRSAANFKMHYVKSYYANSYVVEVWLVKNNGKNLQEVLEKTFFKTGDLAISVQNRLLESGAKTYLYVLRGEHA
jgi:type-F conjugative transfer system secretin TraK